MKKIIPVLFFLLIGSTVLVTGCKHSKYKDAAADMLSRMEALGLNSSFAFERNGNDCTAHCTEWNNIKVVRWYDSPNSKSRVIIQFDEGFLSGGDSDDVRIIYNRYYGIDMEQWDWVVDQLTNAIDDNERKTILTDFINGSSTNSSQEWNNLTGYFQEGRFAYSTETSSIKDLESLAFKIEQNKTKKLQDKLVANFGLSEKRAQTVSKTISAYNQISSKRSLTTKEQNKFSQDLLGVDYKKAKKVLLEGESAAFTDLTEKAAQLNGTSPEQVGAIINELFL